MVKTIALSLPARRYQQENIRDVVVINPAHVTLMSARQVDVMVPGYRGTVNMECTQITFHNRTELIVLDSFAETCAAVASGKSPHPDEVVRRIKQLLEEKKVRSREED